MTTIIVLLILAGISIAQLTGNGLFEKAKLVKEVSKNAQEDEEDKIKQYGNEINSYITANRNFTPINYSTDEQDTGLNWIDNKNIYQKTIVYTNPELLSPGYHQVEHNIENIDSIIKINIMYVRNDGYFIPAPNGQTDSNWNTMNAGASKTKIDYNIGNSLTNNYAIKKIIIDIEYTKTTD